MHHNLLKALLISDFNIENLAGLLNNSDELPVIDAVCGPYGQLMPILINGEHPAWKQKPEILVVWTRPEAISETFRRLINFERVLHAKVLEEVDEFCVPLSRAAKNVKTLFIMAWQIPTSFRGYGFLEWRKGIGLRQLVMQMNLRMAENLNEVDNVLILDSFKWAEKSGKSAFQPKAWYLGKIPFGNEVFKWAVQDIKTALSALSGRSKKIIIVDLDDTLWGGVLGDLGWENLILGGHDPVGESFVDFQRSLKAISQRGVVIGIVSKNDENIALEAIEKHPEMVLRKNNFAGWRINWDDKAKNIIELVTHLNLGLDSVVFIDDNPVERARVRQALPEVYVAELPEDNLLYKNFIQDLSCFDTPKMTEEDRERTKMYVMERKRNELKIEVQSIEGWLRSLETKVKLAPFQKEDSPRILQLINKTNQMNLSTRRLAESELINWINQTGHKMWSCRVGDKFGDSGLTGIISLEIKGRDAQIVDFLLSCRVIGRRVEETLIWTAADYAIKQGLLKIYAKHIPTPKNMPCLEFFKKSGFLFNQDSDAFVWELKQPYPYPQSVQIEMS